MENTLNALKEGFVTIGFMFEGKPYAAQLEIPEHNFGGHRGDMQRYFHALADSVERTLRQLGAFDVKETK